LGANGRRRLDHRPSGLIAAVAGDVEVVVADARRFPHLLLVCALHLGNVDKDDHEDGEREDTDFDGCPMLRKGDRAHSSQDAQFHCYPWY
jgi:hypothetical protein